MFERRLGHLVPQHKLLGVEVMVKPEEIERMLEMRACGWGAKRIAAELGCARNTVRRYLRAGGAIRYRQPQRVSFFFTMALFAFHDGTFFPACGNCGLTWLSESPYKSGQRQQWTKTVSLTEVLRFGLI